MTDQTPDDRTPDSVPDPPHEGTDSAADPAGPGVAEEGAAAGRPDGHAATEQAPTASQRPVGPPPADPRFGPPMDPRFGPPMMPPPPFAPVVKEPWVNPRKRTPAIAVAVLAGLVVLGGGIAIGATTFGTDDHHDTQFFRPTGYGMTVPGRGMTGSGPGGFGSGSGRGLPGGFGMPGQGSQGGGIPGRGQFPGSGRLPSGAPQPGQAPQSGQTPQSGGSSSPTR